MKNFKTKFLGLALAGLILGACSQTGTYENADLMNEQAVAEKAGFKLTPFGTGNANARAYADADCSVDCIDLSAETVEYYEKSGSATPVSWGNGNHTKNLSWVSYNTDTEFKIVVLYTRTRQGNGSTDGNLTITYNGEEQAPEAITSGSATTYTFDLPEGWAGCDEIEFSLSEDSDLEGDLTRIISGSDSYSLFPVCSDCDIEGNEFTGEAVSCDMTDREAVYTFGSDEGVSYFKMQGGLNNFTGDDADVYINGVLVDFNSISDDDWTTGTVAGFTVGQRIPGGSSNRNIRVEGGLGTCEEVVVKIVWNSSNSGETITGNWTVEDNLGVELAPEIQDLSCE